MSIAKDFANSIKDATKEKTSSYDTQAIVTRIEGDTAWVHIPGGVNETPVQLTVNASEGDVVQVRVANGKAWITGNASAPPTDDKRANIAYYTATSAQEEAQLAHTAAEDAIGYAETARQAAEEAQSQAQSASEAADSAQTSADSAQTSADSATQSANTALSNLGVIENVVGVLNLLAEHGEYSVTTDEEVIPDKWYFERSGTAPNYVYSVVNAPTSVYHLTEDTAIDSTKTYYTRTGTGAEDDPYVYTEVTNPVVADIGTYYEKYYELTSIDEAVQNYVSSHLVLSGDSLFLQSTGTSAKLELNTEDGVVLYGTDGKPRAQYGDNAIIGSPDGFHIKIDGTNNKISFYENATNEVAYMSSSALYVRNSLSFGHFIFYERDNGHFTLKKID